MPEQLVRHSQIRGGWRLTMDSRANALGPPLMEALRRALERRVEAGGEALILTSSHPTLFCPGWDLKLLSGAERTDLERFLDLFNQLVLDLFSYPGPTVAAVNGHAVAGGCLLAMACDLRIMATGRARIGLAEINLGVPVPAPCVRMLGARVAPPALEELLFAGDGCTAERALHLGVVRRTASPAQLPNVAEDELLKLANKPRRAYVETKRFLYRDVWRAMAGERDRDNEAFLESWFSPATLQAIRGRARSL